MRTLAETDFRGKIKPPVENGVLKIERYAQRLTQGYSAYGGSFLWALVDVKNVLHDHSKEFQPKKKTEIGQDLLNTIFSMFPYIYVIIFLNFEFAEETLHTDIWTIGNVT